MTSFDQEQMQAINAMGGHYLVFAAPGCGKTSILTERIVNAHQQGIPFDEMLCLTFTNRASREMKERINKAVGEDCNDLFVGNIHHFCSNFLFSNNLLAANTSVISDEEQGDILTYIDDHFFLGHDGNVIRSKVKEITDLEIYLTQRRLGHPQQVYKQDNKERKGDIYGVSYEECYLHAASKGFDVHRIEDNDAWRRLRYAMLYHQYKKEHLMIDFSDLLVLGFEALRNGQGRKYRWIQVDEVQDLNFLQLAIIDALTADDATVMYLGDEQQAIYTFLGAKLDCLNHLRERCQGHILTLSHNYRSPEHLLNVFNTYAQQVLKIPGDMLPRASQSVEYSSRDLILAQSASLDAEMERAVKMVQYYRQFPHERLAVLVPTNREADRVSMLLNRAGISHFKISGSDLFKSDSYLAFSSLFSVLINEFNTLAWARLLYGISICPRQVEARELVDNMRKLMITPFDIFLPEPRILTFCNLFEEGEFVIFDTETTGLNVFEDDIVQIAAFKVYKGKKVEGSDLNIILETDRPIPDIIDGHENPLIHEYATHPHFSRKEGLQTFLKYIGDLPVLGHNTRYDSLILKHNVLRELGEDLTLEVYDSLRLIKCVRPDLKRYKLKFLLEELHLEGENSHLANDDIEATLNLVQYCVEEARYKRKDLSRYCAQTKTKILKSKLQSLESLLESIRCILDTPMNELNCSMADVMQGAYDALRKQGFITPLGTKFDIFLNHVRKGWIQGENIYSLRDLISCHLMEMTSSLNEGDLINSIDNECNPIFVMTVHKGKGLEFDNVIVLNVCNGNYPKGRDRKALRGNNQHEIEAANASIMESARCLYVAITRASKRLCISYPVLDARGFDTTRSPFVEPIAHFFLK